MEKRPHTDCVHYFYSHLCLSYLFFLCIWQAGYILFLTIRARISYFFDDLYKGISVKILQIVWGIVFIIPLILTTIVEIIICYTIKAIGELLDFFFGCLGFFTILWLPFGSLWGLIYTGIGYIFYGIFILFSLPIFIMDCTNYKKNKFF